ncbi:uncharacterized protein LOC143143465 isoform X7 [Ptiloglossa arizonensis]|uniref:uncharacterized protein LOC143143465 isoform X7 n=1 Tax=Ptiloglossa arizonensis TaxID=3350558 RepID=UPI003F9FB649
MHEPTLSLTTSDQSVSLSLRRHPFSSQHLSLRLPIITTGTTALFFAAQGGYMDIASLLLEHGSVVDSCSIDGGTPLFVASQFGHLDVVEGLIERGANPNAHMKDGATALFIAAQNGHVRILEVLLEHGAKTDAARTDGATPLWIGAQMGHDHVVRRLLKAGAKVDATRHDGATPLFKAAHKGHTAVVGELLKYRPSLGILPNGESALHAAALTGQMTVARQLVGAGADPLLVNQEGVTPLQLAVRHSQTQVANYLKDKVRTRTGTS